MTKVFTPYLKLNHECRESLQAIVLLDQYGPDQWDLVGSAEQ
jgi:hypothetical protein